MRDIFTELFRGQGRDPIQAARQAMRPALPLRFYQKVSTACRDNRFFLLLDGNLVRTPARRSLAVPTAALAEALAAEWQAQGERIDPRQMPLTRLSNSIIDGVEPAPGPVAAEVLKYLRSDLLFYRAEAPQGLRARQAELWDPILAWARQTFGAAFRLAEGVRFVAQSETALRKASLAIPADPWRLGAVHAMMTITGSALLALAVLLGRLTVEAAFTAAHVDEDWNMAQWGGDALALEGRALRRREMAAAGLLLDTLAAGDAPDPAGPVSSATRGAR